MITARQNEEEIGAVLEGEKPNFVIMDISMPMSACVRMGAGSIAGTSATME